MSEAKVSELSWPLNGGIHSRNCVMRSSGLPLHNKALRKTCAEKNDPLCNVGCSGLSPLTSLIKRYFFEEQFCLLKADGSGTVFFFAPTSRAAQLRSKWQESDLENGVACGHILFHRNRGLN
jgi:hypothetical protein